MKNSIINNFKFNGKTIFVVGGLGLIGEEVTNELANLGAKIVIIDNNYLKFIKNKKSKKTFSTIFFEKLDLRNKKAIKKTYNKIIKKHGCPDVFVNCSYPRTSDWPKNIDTTTEWAADIASVAGPLTVFYMAGSWMFSIPIFAFQRTGFGSALTDSRKKVWKRPIHFLLFMFVVSLISLVVWGIGFGLTRLIEPSSFDTDKGIGDFDWAPALLFVIAWVMCTLGAVYNSMFGDILPDSNSGIETGRKSL